MASAKTCTRCGETKAVDQFYKRLGKPTAKCKMCIAAQVKQYQKDNKEAISAQKKQYQKDNKEAISAKKQQYYADNQEAAKQWRADNRERLAAKARTPEARAVRNAAQHARRSTPEGKVKQAAGHLHRSFYLGDLGAVRLRKAENLVGCTRQEYRDYIASQFKSGMSHGNTDWEIDHIVPKKAFKGELEANLEIIFWYGNVQPLWKAENKSKNCKYTAEAKQSLITRFDIWKARGSPPPGI